MERWNIAGVCRHITWALSSARIFHWERSMTPFRTPVLAVAVASSLLCQSPGRDHAPPRQKIDVSKLGPQVGERVSDFSLKDQNGKVWTLQSIMGPKGAMLVFVRSADW